MKKALYQALIALLGLLLLSALLFAGAIYYRLEVLWAAAFATLGQSLVVALAWWGLTLAKQQDDLRDTPALGTLASPSTHPASPFRMSITEHSSLPTATSSSTSRPLEISFQRLLVALTGAALLVLAGIIIYLVVNNVLWAQKNPDQPFPIAGSLVVAPSTNSPAIITAPTIVDELALLLGLGSAFLYAILLNLSRVRRSTLNFADAVSGNFIMGIPGIAALAVAITLAYLKIPYASEIASSIIAALLFLQGLELLANSLRSYHSLDEIDGHVVDLLALPLIPMLTSVWISGLKILFAQSFGLSRNGPTGVVGRMMPRALLTLVLLAILVSCLRVVGPGEVAVVERLGYALRDGPADDAQLTLLESGLHFQMPWPIDQLVYIPHEKLQFTSVGTELHEPPGLSEAMKKKIDFRFWRYSGAKPVSEEEDETQYVTGDPVAPQILETYVTIWWRVKDPAQFYNALSHSEFFERDSRSTKSIPIFEALIQQSASYAVTQAFAIHKLDDILTTNRAEVTAHCQQILEDKLIFKLPNGDHINSGIEIVSLIIKDVHPPVGVDEVPDSKELDGVRRGPANAFEFVISSQEIREIRINEARRDQVGLLNQSHGAASNAESQAVRYKLDQISRAQGEAAKFNAIFGSQSRTLLEDSIRADFLKLPSFQALSPDEQTRRVIDAISPPNVEQLRRQKALYETLKDILPRVNKVLVGPGVDPPQIWQTTDSNKPQRPGS